MRPRSDSRSLAHTQPTHFCPSAAPQHNLLIPDGFSGLASFLPTLPPPVTSDVKRVFRDGDLTWAHTDYNFGGPNVGFDILEFDCGLAVEHWDNLQPPAGPNPSGSSMLDGTVQASTSDPAVTLASKKTAYKLVSRALVAGDTSVLDEVIGDTYIQHNPEMADGKDGLLAWFGAYIGAGNVISYTEIHAVLGQGDFVLVVSEGLYGPSPGVPTAFYDMFRINTADGMIIEHWDVIAAIPPAEEQANTNGMFSGFPDYVQPELFA